VNSVGMIHCITISNSVCEGSTEVGAAVKQVQSQGKRKNKRRKCKGDSNVNRTDRT